MFYKLHHHGTLTEISVGEQSGCIVSWTFTVPCCFCVKLTALQSLQPNESLQDGCDSHSCKVNEKGEFIWERRITSCPPFDSRRCLAEGVSSEMGPVSTFPNKLCHGYGSVYRYLMCIRVGNPNPLPAPWLNWIWTFFEIQKIVCFLYFKIQAGFIWDCTAGKMLSLQ